MVMCVPDTTDWSCVGTAEEISGLDPDLKARAEALAWYSLASLCAFQIGVCPTVLRPCAARCAPPGTWLEAPVRSSSFAGLPTMTIGSNFTPHISGGVWVNSCRCSSGDSCSCGRLEQVELPGPVGDIVSVTIDGETIPPTSYRVDNGNMLVSVDPDVIWPSCQDYSAGPNDEGSFVVTYYRGAAPNELTNYAAGLLAHEFYKACSNNKCKLPSGVTQVARNGVTYEIEMGLFPNGATGIKAVDAVIRIYNPYAVKSPSRVLTPQSSGPRRSTWYYG